MHLIKRDGGRFQMQGILLSRKNDFFATCGTDLSKILTVKVCCDIKTFFSIALPISPAAVFIDSALFFENTNLVQTLLYAARQYPVIALGAGSDEVSRRTADRMGISHYFSLPAQKHPFYSLLDRLKKDSALPACKRSPGEPPAYETADMLKLIGSSVQMESIKRQLAHAAKYPVPIILRGETGTGKTLLARSIHRCSARSAGPFLEINMAAIADSLLESELFGCVKGAYTGAVDKEGFLSAADTGTLFMDEIGSITPHLQAALLGVLDSRCYFKVGSVRQCRTDVRFVFATNANLEQMVADGIFREDLYNRIMVFPLEIPALRERRCDILEFTDCFLSGSGKILGQYAMQQLFTYCWPGNIRELKSSLERACIMTYGKIIEYLPL